MPEVKGLLGIDVPALDTPDNKASYMARRKGYLNITVKLKGDAFGHLFSLFPGHGRLSVCPECSLPPCKSVLLMRWRQDIEQVLILDKLTIGENIIALNGLEYPQIAVNKHAPRGHLHVSEFLV